jgi:lysophospholipase L1-like esterase
LGSHIFFLFPVYWLDAPDAPKAGRDETFTLRYTVGLPHSGIRALRSALTYLLLIGVSVLCGAIVFEVYLSYHTPRPVALPFYNHLYPYVMFRPLENYDYHPPDTYAMSHFKSKITVYTSEDGFRVPSMGYNLPKQKPAGQLRIAFLGGSLVQLASTYETTLPGSLKTLLQQKYPGRDIEVVNAGIQSCVSRQSVAQLLFTVVDYHPDIVILYDGGNDLGLPLTYESRPNFPYNFQTMEEAWDTYRAERQDSVWHLALERSNLYRLIRSRLHPDERKLVPTADSPFAGTNAVPADKVLTDPAYVSHHIAEYLSNWRKLIELSAAYHYQPVLILTPAGGLDPGYAVPLMMKDFHLDRATAGKWIRAFDLLYDEAGRQIDGMRGEYRDAVFMNLTHELSPPEKYFWDMAHVYDEANMILAERIYSGIRPQVEAR